MTLEEQLWDAGFKLLAAVVLSAPLGLERERKERPAGLRTHVLVCLGATLMLVISEFLELDVSADGARLDKARIAAGVITGIGFLGAGTIFTVGADQHGLTTAAMIWFVAALGVAIGAGYIAVAAGAAAVALAVVVGFEYLERFLPNPHRPYRLTVRSTAGISDLSRLRQLIQEHEFHVELSQLRFEDKGRVAEAVFRVTSRRKGDIASLAKSLSEHYRDAESIVFDR